MITIGPSTSGTQWFLNGISNLQNQQTQVQRQLTSGFRVQDASDSPGQTSELIGLGSSLAAVQAYQANLGRVQTEANSADSSLATAITLIQDAQSLAAQGASSTASASSRQALAGQVQGIQQQLVSLANTTVEGRFIFGGDLDQSAPYAYNAASATGVDTLTAAASSGLITDPQGQTVYQALTAQHIFDPVDAAGAPTTNNTFAALQTLVTSLQANDTTGIQTALNSLDTASSYVIQQQAYYGTAENRLTAEQTNASSQATALQTSIAGIRDTDFTQAATQLTQLNTDETAAFSAQASISKKSLFDFLG
jgi:flagellar hook-associated protein 3 FlgL